MIKLHCPQGCGEVLCNWPQIIHNTNLPSYRCPVCDIRFIIANPSYLMQDTEMILDAFTMQPIVKSDRVRRGGNK